MKPTCEDLNFDNERHCENDADFMCICCGTPVCREHRNNGQCPYGGEPFIDLEGHV